MTEREICECGWEVKGKSEKHLKSNMKAHRKSKMHKQLMKNKIKGEGEDPNY